MQLAKKKLQRMQLIVKDDKLQKYRDHIQTGTELGEANKKYFDRYFFAFTLLLDGLSERKVVESLMYSPDPIGGLSQAHAYNIVMLGYQLHLCTTIYYFCESFF